MKVGQKKNHPFTPHTTRNLHHLGQGHVVDLYIYIRKDKDDLNFLVF